VVVVRANEQIPDKGKCFCPIAETDEQVLEDVVEQEEKSYFHGDLEEAESIPDEGHPDPPVLPLCPDDLPPQSEDRPPPGQVVEEEVEEEAKEEEDKDKDVLTVRQRPDNTGQEALPSRPRRQKKPLNKF
jgi:hypothetical protein